MPGKPQLSSSHGSCLCGAVTFTAALPSMWVAHCHCTRCQRAHGAPFVTWVGVEAGLAQVLDRQGVLQWFVAPEGGSRGFCGRCGSPMFFRSERWPGELHIARALFLAPIDREPQMHVYYDSHVDWVALPDSLPRKADPS